MAFCEYRFFSNALGKQTSAFVILPEDMGKGPFSVMFLLHGLSDDHTIWLRRTSIERYVSNLPLIVVMPNGDRGFYTDAAEGFRYETALDPELVDRIKDTFPTKAPWCVSGLSMGGYGATKLALRHPGLFASAHAMSAAMGFAHFPMGDRGDEWAKEFERVTGPKPAGGKDDLFALASELAAGQRPKLLIDCGVDDFLLEANRAFDRHLQGLEFGHTYREHPGNHTWEYWDEHVQDGLKFHAAHLGW